MRTVGVEWVRRMGDEALCASGGLDEDDDESFELDLILRLDGTGAGAGEAAALDDDVLAAVAGRPPAALAVPNCPSLAKNCSLVCASVSFILISTSRYAVSSYSSESSSDHDADLLRPTSDTFPTTTVSPSPSSSRIQPKKPLPRKTGSRDADGVRVRCAVERYVSTGSTA